MSLDATELVVAGSGAIYRAPAGTTMPSDIDNAPDPGAGWVNLGYTSETGVKFTLSRNVNEVMGWQSYYPLRVVVTDIPTEIEAELLQWNNDTVTTAMGGGTFDTQGGGVRYTPPVESYVDEFALVVDGEDGGKKYRFWFDRVMVSDTVEFSFVRSNPVTLPVKVKVLEATAGGEAWLFDTDDDSITPDPASV